VYNGGYITGCTTEYTPGWSITGRYNPGWSITGGYTQGVDSTERYTQGVDSTERYTHGGAHTERYTHGGAHTGRYTRGEKGRIMPVLTEKGREKGRIMPFSAVFDIPTFLTQKRVVSYSRLEHRSYVTELSTLCKRREQAALCLGSVNNEQLANGASWRAVLSTLFGTLPPMGPGPA